MMQRRSLTLALTCGLSLLPSEALAYIGPGGGLSAIGIFLALVVGILAALFGFLWYPLKRFLAKRKGPVDPE